MAKRNILKITQTALLLALLLVIQFLTIPYGQIVTGTLVNLILLLGVMLIGWGPGIFIAFTSPLSAFMLGFGPALIQVVVFIAGANCLFVTLAWLLARKSIIDRKKTIVSIFALIAAGVAKTAFLWIGLVKIALPLLPGLTPQQNTVIAASFTWPQLLTAFTGSLLALFSVPILHQVLRQSEKVAQ